MVKKIAVPVGSQLFLATGMSDKLQSRNVQIARPKFELSVNRLTVG